MECKYRYECEKSGVIRSTVLLNLSRAVVSDDMQGGTRIRDKIYKVTVSSVGGTVNNENVYVRCVTRNRVNGE